MKNIERKLLLILLSIIIAGCIPKHTNAISRFANWAGNAERIYLGDSYYTIPYDYDGLGTSFGGAANWFYIPCKMNININVVSDTSKRIYQVSLYNSQGKELCDVDWVFGESSWKYNPNTKKAYLNKKITLSKGYYYLATETTSSKQCYTIKIGGSLYNKPTLKSVKKSGKRKATITWSKKSDFKGYQLERRTKSGKYKRICTASGSTSKFKNKGLKRKIAYYYRIRGYRVIDGHTFYSGYSSAKKIKLK